jgi:hypothetical protein
MPTRKVLGRITAGDLTCDQQCLIEVKLEQRPSQTPAQKVCPGELAVGRFDFVEAPAAA